MKLSESATLLQYEATRKRAENAGLRVDRDGTIDDQSLKNVDGGKARVTALAHSGVLDLDAAAKLKRDAVLGEVKGHGSTELAQRSSAVQAIALSLNGLTTLLEATGDPLKVMERAKAIVADIDQALPTPTSLGDLTPAALEKLTHGLEGVSEAASAYLPQLDAALGQAKATKNAPLAGLLDEIRGALLDLLRFAGAALSEPIKGANAPELASEICRGHLSARSCLQLAHGIEWFSSQTGLSTDDIALAFQWYVGKMSEIGFYEPKRLYEAFDAQERGEVAKTPGGHVLPPIKPDSLADRAFAAISTFSRAIQNQTEPPADLQAFLTAAQAEIKVRTSEKYPLQVAWVDAGTPGKLGLTLAPGKKQPSLFGYVWDRDLKTDLTVLRKEHQVDVLVPLIEDHELELLGIANLVEAAKSSGMAVRRSPTRDLGTPDMQEAHVLAQELAAQLKAGKNVLIHCKGGLGRAGTITTATLVELGKEVAAAMAMVRAARPGAVENQAQEDFLFAFAKGS